MPYNIPPHQITPPELNQPIPDVPFLDFDFMADGAFDVSDGFLAGGGF
jgi:hypothetical protein